MTFVNLTQNSLSSLSDNITVPGYDRNRVTTGIVHIGPSAFFRGHLAVYVDDLLNQGATDLGICAVSLKTNNVSNALKSQDCLYTVVEQSAQGKQARVIGSVKEIIVARDNPQVVLQKMASPETKLVTMTVTQGGYYYKNGNLDFDHEDIKADLTKADEPSSTVGFIVKALEMRMQAGIKPFAVMSCDNLPNNSFVLRNVVLAYAAQKSPELRDWIANEVPFPSTMVDRIVPKTTPENVDQHKQEFGYGDAWPIYTESFRQLVIENVPAEFPFPDFSKAGALHTEDVGVFELMKIRLLNGTHMALGMIGRMAGYTYSHEAIRDPAIRSFIKGMMDEMTQTLNPVKGVDLEAYKATIITRLESEYMKDELARLARNGVDKMDSRFLSPLRDALSRQTPCERLVFAAASWIEYLKRAGPGFDIQDEKAVNGALPEKARASGSTGSAILANKDIFGSDLPSSRFFQAKFKGCLTRICNHPDNILEALQFPDNPEPANTPVPGVPAPAP
ncbi:MAG: hypothetical protein JWO78_1385 [Micavibrio sp.]|nr:hypothetical protein [Micavibrio sp.]